MLNYLLSFGSVMGTIGSVVLALLVLLLTITVHEFGHYIVGKLLKFKINEFSIGMGPAVFQRKKKDGEVFSIRLLPLGGYCAFDGEDNSGALPEKTDKSADNAINAENAEETPVETVEALAPKTPDPNSFNNKKPWERILVLLAGGTFNFIAAILVIMIYFTAYGHSAFSAVEIRKPDTIEMAYSLVEDDIILEINDKFIYFTTDLSDSLNGKKKGDFVKVKVLRQGNPVETTVMLRNDVETSNLADIYPALTALGIATVPAVYTEGESDFTNGNFLFRFNDATEYEDCTRIYDLDTLYDGLKVLNAGESVEVWTYNDTDGKYLITVTASADFDAVDKTSRHDVLNAFGLTSAAYSYQCESTYIRLGFFEGLGRSFVYAFKTVGVTFRSIGQLFGGKLGVDALSGPVGTISLTSQYVRLGFSYLLDIAALIGISIGIFNLLPIPALDGAKAVFVAIEWVRGKPINQKVEGWIHTIGLIALFAFAILVDVIKLFI